MTPGYGARLKIAQPAAVYISCITILKAITYNQSAANCCVLAPYSLPCHRRRREPMVALRGKKSH